MKYETCQMARIEDILLGDRNKFIVYKEYNRSEDMKIKSRQMANNEHDMLRGNVNRMFITKDRIELDSMYDFAKSRLASLYEYNRERIENLEKNRK